MDIANRESFSLSYATPKKEKIKMVEQTKDSSPKTEVQHVNNKALVLNSMPTPQSESKAISNTNMCSPQEFTNPYNLDQPVEPNA